MIAKSLLQDPKSRQLVSMFIGCLPEKVHRLRADVLEDNMTDLRMEAHKLKGIAAHFGCHEISVMAGKLAENSRTCSQIELEEYVSVIESLSCRAKADLNHTYRNIG